MKVVGLNRMREVETELQQRFSDLDFKFYKKASEIPESDLADLDILVVMMAVSMRHFYNVARI